MSQFAMPLELFAGALAGFCFGFLLRKGYLTRFEVIVGQLLLRDFTVLKVILTAIIVGSIGVYGMMAWKMVPALALSSVSLLAAAVGGLIFGIGMAVMGYCPGSGLAALADGARDMIFGLLGMLVGPALFAECYPLLKKSMALVDSKPLTLPAYFGISPWIVIGLLAIAGLLLFLILEVRSKPSSK